MGLMGEHWARNWQCNGCHDSKCSCEPAIEKPIGNHERRSPRHKPFLTLENINGMTIAKKAHPNVVVVVAITKNNEIVLAEQFRVGVNSNVIGLPAGHIGDEPGKEAENAIEAAKRELLEETGYGNGTFYYLGSSASTPGMTDEITHVVLGLGVTKIQEANSGDENITIHEIPKGLIKDYLTSSDNRIISTQMLAALWAAKYYLKC